MKKKSIKVSKSYRLFQLINVCILVSLSLATLYPLVHVVMASLSDGNALLAHRGLLFWPVGKTNVNAFESVLNNPNILTGYKNTLFVLLVGTTFQVSMTALGAYVLSRQKFILKTPIMLMIVFTMFFEGGIIPFFFVVKNLHLTNSLWAMIIPFSVSAYNLIIMRTAFAAIPVSLEESARLDGASHWTILLRIILPLSKPVIAVMVLYYGVGIWNGWFWASVFIRPRELFPLQLVLREILIANDTSTMTAGTASLDIESVSETIKYATIVVSTLPILVIYPFLQKYFVKGVMIGAVKG